MFEPVPRETLCAGESYPTLHQNPNPLPLPVSYTSRSPESPPWEALARDWLSSLPMNHQPSFAEIDAWIESNRASLPDDLQSVPRRHLHHRILSFHDPSRSLNQVDLSNEAEFPYRFQRTDLWKPVYRWLESLDKDVLVNAKEISEWLAANPEVTERLFSKHSRYHMMHYIQRMHLKLLKKRGKLPKGLQLSAARASVKSVNGGVTTREITLPRKLPNSTTRENGTVLHKNKEAFLRYELLTDLQNQLTSVLLKQKYAMNSKNSYPSCLVEQMPENATTSQSSDKGGKDACCQIIPGDASFNQGVVNIHVTELSKTTILSEIKSGQKRKQNPIIVTPAWSYSEASSEASEIHQPVSSQCEKASNINIWKGDAHSSSLASSYRKSIVMCLQGREKGTSWPSTCCLGGYAGRNQERWIPFLQGWRSLGKQFEGPAVWLSRRNCSSWIPTWCAYTSSVAIAQPNDRQGIQKVLDVRFHPEGLPQLVCSSNQAPNELLLYNLLSGKAVQLSGHNCQEEMDAEATVVKADVAR
ncbi:WD domain, G-beta repeat [Musa troglodytarum]|uniref:WD domain, G-beta repeat n=1 Tax=Musa troglodytarum TaxID=320322 RepID=A0A9E7EGA4_9LILI|nr:WD domain, G-beta repeat [Musa troglodytarum]